MKPKEFAKKEHFTFEDLKNLVEFLRSPDGCSWDREQTHESIRCHFIEEAYEVAEGIDKKDNELLCEELGDMLFQVLFHADLAREEGAFLLSHVIDGICKKMIRRHPHLFSENKEMADWEEIKKAEKGEKTKKDTLSRISTSLPALMRAVKFIEKGADLPENNDFSSKEDKLGAKLFRLVSECEKEKVDPEAALNHYLEKIILNCTNYE